jgi:hypothetical protein
MVPLQGDLAAAHAYGLDYGYAAGRETAVGAEHDEVLPLSRQSRRPELTGRGT